VPRPTLQALIFSTAIGIAFLAPVAWWFYWPASGGFDVVGYHLGRDFLNMWSGPQVVARHGVMMLFDLSGYHWAQADLTGRFTYFHTWSYPPYVLFFAYPFSLLSYMPSLVLWSVLGLAVYAAAVVPLVAPEQRRATLLFLLLAPATLVNIIGGQNGFFTAALLLGGIVLMDRRPWTAGALFGLLAIKPHLGLVIAAAVVATMAWRTFVAAGLTGTALVVLSWLFYGTEPWLIWLTETSAYHYQTLVRYHGFYTFMMTSVFASLRVMGVPPEFANVIQTAVTLGVLAGTMVMIRRASDVALRALLLTSGTLLASPYSFNYDMTALTAAMLWVMLSRPSLSRARVLIFGAAWVAPSAVWTLHGMSIGFSPLAYGAVFITALSMIREEAAQSAPGRPALPQPARA
jgi:hypothetical protein